MSDNNCCGGKNQPEVKSIRIKPRTEKQQKQKLMLLQYKTVCRRTTDVL
jgi:hypothetical protein